MFLSEMGNTDHTLQKSHTHLTYYYAVTLNSLHELFVENKMFAQMTLINIMQKVLLFCVHYVFRIYTVLVEPVIVPSGATLGLSGLFSIRLSGSGPRAQWSIEARQHTQLCILERWSVLVVRTAAAGCRDVLWTHWILLVDTFHRGLVCHFF